MYSSLRLNLHDHMGIGIGMALEGLKLIELYHHNLNDRSQLFYFFQKHSKHILFVKELFFLLLILNKYLGNKKSCEHKYNNVGYVRSTD